MAKFFGKIGYATSTETSPGVFTDVITEHEYSGDVLRQNKQWIGRDQVNDDLDVANRISIVSDDFANENIPSMRYVIWSGSYWSIKTVEIERPRLILSVGGVYNGNKA